MKNPPAAIGFRVKTGRAIAVLVAAGDSAPFVLERRAVQLWDPGVPESQEPYHAALELPEKEAADLVRRVTRAVQKVASRALGELVDSLQERGHEVLGIGLVVGSDIDPAKLGNAHIHAHALEGRLFRQVLESGADALNLAWLTVVERELFEKGAAALGKPPDLLRKLAGELGRPVGRPWGAEEKSAAIAAWMALAR